MNNLDIGPDKTQVSVVTYSSRVYNNFSLNQFQTKDDILSAMGRIPFISGKTRTSRALKYMTETSFKSVHGARMNVPHIGVLITGGPATYKKLTLYRGQVAKNDYNITIFTVGVGSSVDTNELSFISSIPRRRYHLSAEHFEALKSLSGPLSIKLCNGKNCILYMSTKVN